MTTREGPSIEDSECPDGSTERIAPEVLTPELLRGIDADWRGAIAPAASRSPNRQASPIGRLLEWRRARRPS